MSRLDEFTKLLKDFGAIGALVIGGSLLTPILVAAVGLAPPDTPGLQFVASVMILVVMILLFQFLPQRPRAFAFLLVSSIGLLVVTMMAHLYLHMRFVTGQLVLGCGWKPRLAALAQKDLELGLDATSQCPGDFRALLGMQDDDPFEIWTADSIELVKFLLSASWVAMFVFLALALGAFVIHNGRQPARSG